MKNAGLRHPRVLLTRPHHSRAEESNIEEENCHGPVVRRVARTFVLVGQRVIIKDGQLARVMRKNGMLVEVNEAALNRVDRGLCAVASAELFQDATDMDPDCFLGYFESCGNLLIAAAPGN